ncbi:MAG: RCC1 domain-containing protein, partial [Myxococcaceae bacterium]|nr:RCC1 domain-containing protein [Myxococcaceae bacterium]
MRRVFWGAWLAFGVLACPPDSLEGRPCTTDGRCCLGYECAPDGVCVLRSGVEPPDVCVMPMGGGAAAGMSGGLAGGMSGGLAGGMSGGLAGGTSGGLAGGAGGGAAGGSAGGFAGGAAGGIAGGTSGGLAGGAGGGAAGGGAGGLAGGAGGGTAGGMSGGLAGGAGGGAAGGSGGGASGGGGMAGGSSGGTAGGAAGGTAGGSPPRSGPVNCADAGVLTNVVGLAAGAAHACVIVSDGGVLCWGSNASFQSGRANDGGPLACASPVPLPFPAVHLAAARDHTCAAFAVSNQPVLCWGDVPLLGPASPQPRAIGLTALVWGGLTAGARHSCAWVMNLGLQCSGESNEAQLGPQVGPGLGLVSAADLLSACGGE